MSVEFKDMDFTINNLLYDLTSGKYIPIPPKKKKKKNSGKYIFLKIKKKKFMWKIWVALPKPSRLATQLTRPISNMFKMDHFDTNMIST